MFHTTPENNDYKMSAAALNGWLQMLHERNKHPAWKNDASIWSYKKQ